MQINGLTMPFTDPAGVAHPNSFWIPATVVMDNIDRNGGVDWVGYDSTTAYLAGNQSVQGAGHHTAIPTALYMGIVSFPVPQDATTYGEVTAAALVYLAQNVLDTSTGALDVNGNPVMVSFFAGATLTAAGS
jgi:hypothetical protein